MAFQQPDQFAAVGGYSPVVLSRETDLVTLARSAGRLDQLHIALDVGAADTLAAGTRQLAQALRERGLTISLTLNDGGHNRPYWRAHTAEYLRFLLTAISAPSHGCYSH